MPGFNGTGPRGLGPMTGKGMGYCVINLGEEKKEDTSGSGKEVSNMPRGDGTGPAGLGPMTGRAAGFCAGYPVPGYMNPISGRGFWGRGRGGGGRGWGRGAYGYPAYGGGAYPYAPEVTPQQEAEFLKEQAKALQEELKSINERLGTLAKSAQEKK